LKEKEEIRGKKEGKDRSSLHFHHLNRGEKKRGKRKGRRKGLAKTLSSLFWVCVF